MTEIHKDVPRGLRPLVSNAKAGNVLSQYELFDCYLTGKDVGEKDLAEASAYLDLLYASMAQACFKLDSLELYEFRRYRNLSIEFEPDLTVIIGENGAGKTSIVESIARVLSWFGSRIVKANSNGLHVLESDINTHAKDYAQVVGSFSLNEKTSFEMSMVKTVAGWAGDISSDLIVSTQLGGLYRLLVADEENSSVQLPVFAYYAVERASGNYSRVVAEKDVKKFFSSRFNGYKELSGASAKVDSFLARYVELFNLAESGGGDYKAKLQLVKDAIESAVPYINNLSVDRSSGRTEVKLDNFGNRIDFSQLSQGQKTLAALVGDLALRMLTLNPAMVNPLHAQGTVLIDEIDLHLHPRLQQTVLLSLTKTFKKVQFIVTTHSPHVLSTVDKRCIRILGFEGDGTACVQEPDFQTKGVISSMVLEQLMGTHSVPEIEESKWITDYSKLIAAGTWETEGGELKELLFQHFGSDHPVIQDLDAQIRLQQFKARVKQKQQKEL